MKTNHRLTFTGISALVVVGLLGAFLLFGQKSEGSHISANSGLSCTNEQFADYTKYMLLAGEMTLSQPPDSGTRLQQQKMIDAFDALTLPKDKTVIAVGHVNTGKIYTTTCEKEKCTLDEMAKPEHACLVEHWNDCPYLAMQFREKKYCFLAPADD